LIKRAGTLAELAQTTGLPVDPLTKSVMEYNEDHKTKIQSPPFYAAQLFPLARKSMGGISIDHQARVLDPHSKAITGLYAAGEVTGEANISGKQALEGTFLGPAIITGRVAARTALKDFSIHGEIPPVANIQVSSAYQCPMPQLPPATVRDRQAAERLLALRTSTQDCFRDSARVHGMPFRDGRTLDPATSYQSLDPSEQLHCLPPVAIAKIANRIANLKHE
jgi:succinate dehydrogenase/fumarate reductase flavoprotein subunit